MDLPINTNNFLKFLTTVSFIGTVYFFSFYDLFSKPYIDEMTKINVQVAELSAESGYLKGKHLDLYFQYKDSAKNGKVSYFYYSKGDSIKQVNANITDYFSTKGQNKQMKLSMDSLNSAGKELAKANFKLDALNQTQKALENNIVVKEIISIILGIISFCVFIYGSISWYKSRDIIDN